MKTAEKWSGLGLYPQVRQQEKVSDRLLSTFSRLIQVDNGYIPVVTILQ